MIPHWNPDHDWIVVMRKVRNDDNPRGRVVDVGLSESIARLAAAKIGQRMPEYNVWAMKREDY